MQPTHVFLRSKSQNHVYFRTVIHTIPQFHNNNNQHHNNNQYNNKIQNNLIINQIE